MYKAKSLLVLPCLLLTSFFLYGQAGRTFVSGAGNDTNPCTLEAPCRTFQAAVDAVAGGGHVVALDSAGYGAVNITKSVSILAPDGVYAGSRVTINSAGADVYLRGLTIDRVRGDDGYPASEPVTFGIEFQQGDSLFVDRCRINGYYYGIHMTAAARMLVKDTRVTKSQYGLRSIAGKVTLVACTFDQNSVVELYDTRAVLTGTQMLRGNGMGLNACFAGTKAVLVRCLMAGSISAALNASYSAVVMVTDSVIRENQSAFHTSESGSILSCDRPGNTVYGNEIPSDFSGVYAAR